MRAHSLDIPQEWYIQWEFKFGDLINTTFSSTDWLRITEDTLTMSMSSEK